MCVGLPSSTATRAVVQGVAFDTEGVRSDASGGPLGLNWTTYLATYGDGSACVKGIICVLASFVFPLAKQGGCNHLVVGVVFWCGAFVDATYLGTALPRVFPSPGVTRFAGLGKPSAAPGFSRM